MNVIPPARPASEPLPQGFALRLDADTTMLGARFLLGGSPTRLMRLSPAGRDAWQALRAAPVSEPATGLLARRLTDGGLAHPVPPHAAAVEATVVIPVYGRPTALNACLNALRGAYPVIVVDDGSPDPVEIAAVCERHPEVVIVRCGSNGGPGAARNAGLVRVRTDLVALLDSDCIAAPSWIAQLAGHFADPQLAAVAPRIVPSAPSSWHGRYARANSSLDMGPRPARVAPGTRVGYVPTAALLLRRSALPDDGVAFDTALRVGEDVDLIWRLHKAGWRVRYEPDVQVTHTEPATATGLLRRRYRYGTSAGPLATRHATAVAPMIMHPWPTLSVLALAAGRPVLAALACGASVARPRRTLRAAGLSADEIADARLPAMAARATQQTAIGLCRYLVQFTGPVLVARLLARLARPRGRTRRGLLLMLLTILAPAVHSWLQRRPDLDPLRYSAAHLADDLAYGAGVWTGCWRARTLRPVLPHVALPAAGRQLPISTRKQAEDAPQCMV